MNRRKKSLVRKVLERDRYMCQCCYFSTIEALEVHHIDPLCAGGKDDDSNMITLCKVCHAFVPELPDDFLEYQRSRGFGGKLSFVEFCKNHSDEYPIGNIKAEFERAMQHHCILIYDKDEAA
jgi:hypothetical protein